MFFTNTHISFYFLGCILFVFSSRINNIQGQDQGLTIKIENIEEYWGDILEYPSIVEKKQFDSSGKLSVKHFYRGDWLQSDSFFYDQGEIIERRIYRSTEQEEPSLFARISMNYIDHRKYSRETHILEQEKKTALFYDHEIFYSDKGLKVKTKEEISDWE